MRAALHFNRANFWNAICVQEKMSVPGMGIVVVNLNFNKKPTDLSSKVDWKSFENENSFIQNFDG